MDDLREPHAFALDKSVVRSHTSNHVKINPSQALAPRSATRLVPSTLVSIAKSQSHGRIGEAATYAKFWMHGIPAYHTGGLRANFAGSDLIVETRDPRLKLWIQVKAGSPNVKDHVYLTQCTSEAGIVSEKFSADFVVFVNLDAKQAKIHDHDGTLRFEHLSFFVVPRQEANELYRDAVSSYVAAPKRDGGLRKTSNLAVHVPAARMAGYQEAWMLVRAAAGLAITEGRVLDQADRRDSPLPGSLQAAG